MRQVFIAQVGALLVGLLGYVGIEAWRSLATMAEKIAQSCRLRCWRRRGHSDGIPLTAGGGAPVFSVS